MLIILLFTIPLVGLILVSTTMLYNDEIGNKDYQVKHEYLNNKSSYILSHGGNALNNDISLVKNKLTSKYKILNRNIKVNKSLKTIALYISVLTLFVSLIIFALIDFSNNQFQFVQSQDEISINKFYAYLTDTLFVAFNNSYLSVQNQPGIDALDQSPSIFAENQAEVNHSSIYLGVDGLSIYFVLLTTIIIPVSLLSNWTSISENVRSFLITILLLETLLLLVFLVLDVLLFYIFFESILPPLFILIGLFGSSERVRASFYLFLYTLLGSLFLLLSIVTMWSIIGTTDFNALYKTNFNHYTQLCLF